MSLQLYEYAIRQVKEKGTIYTVELTEVEINEDIFLAPQYGAHTWPKRSQQKVATTSKRPCATIYLKVVWKKKKTNLHRLLRFI